MPRSARVLEAALEYVGREQRNAYKRGCRP
jgi:hypothetical protein